jgi:drug/metabolite transporter (DMT)-like permease
MAATATWMARKTPRQLVVLASVGAFMLTAPFFAEFIYEIYKHSILVGVISLLLFATGALLYWRAEVNLKQQLQSQDTPEDAILAARSFMQRMSFLVLLLLLMWLGIFIYGLASHGHSSTHGMAFYLPSLALTRLSAMLKPKPVKADSRSWPEKMKQIASDHWGNRGPVA